MLWSPATGLYGDDPPASGRMRWADGYNIRWRLRRPETVGLWRPLLDPGANRLAVDVQAGGEARALCVAPRADGAQVLVGQLNRVMAMVPDPVGSSLSAGTRWTLSDITPLGISTVADGLTADLGRTRINPAWYFVVLGGAVLMGRAGVDEPVFIWDRDPSHRATPIAGSPQGAIAGFATDNGHVVLLGCQPSAGTNRALTVRWCKQGDVSVWTPASDNTARDVQLPEGSRIVGGGASSFGNMVWTDSDLWELVPRPWPVIFEPQRRARQAGLLTNLGWTEAAGRLWWVGGDLVTWVLDGSRPAAVPCPIKAQTFDALSREAAHRLYASALPEFSEVAFWLPTGSQGTIGGCATINYEEAAWSRWVLPRTAWAARSGPLRPLAVDAAGALWEHELPAVDDTPSWRNEQVEARAWSLSSCNFYPQSDQYDPVVQAFGTTRVVLDRVSRHTPGDEQAAITLRFDCHEWTAQADGSRPEWVTFYPETQHHDLRLGGRTQSFTISGQDRSHTRIGDLWLAVQPEGERA